MKKIVVIGDIIASKNLERRAEVQADLLKTLKRINRRRTGGLISPYSITLGDEFEAVYDNSGEIFTDIIEILRAVFPVQIRFAIGTGDIYAPFHKNQPYRMDGPAFYNARSGINLLKENGGILTLFDESAGNAALQNECLALIGHLIMKWDYNKLRILEMLMKGKKVKAIADDLGISDKAVYKTINNEAVRTVIKLLGRIADSVNMSSL